MEVLTPHFRGRKCCRSTNYHGATIQDMGEAGNGGTLGPPNVSQVRFIKLSKRPRLTCTWDRCERSFSADRQDFATADKISCPFRGCDHVWCKQCQRPISPSGPRHSCDGESELKDLMAEKGWKRCPSKLFCRFIWLP
jgi:hypothetical protein